MCTVGECIPLDFDDSHCKSICECCVGITDYGDHNKCTSACRECRNFGTAWEPRRPLKPLDFEYTYNSTPGYATTGTYVDKEGNYYANPTTVEGFLGGVGGFQLNTMNVVMFLVAFWLFYKYVLPKLLKK